MRKYETNRRAESGRIGVNARESRDTGLRLAFIHGDRSHGSGAVGGVERVQVIAQIGEVRADPVDPGTRIEPEVSSLEPEKLRVGIGSSQLGLNDVAGR